MMLPKRRRRRIRCSRLMFSAMPNDRSSQHRLRTIRDESDQGSQAGEIFIYTTGTRLAASIAGEITSMSSGTCQRLVNRTSGAALPAFAPASTNPS
jgi:hypothetical protein